MTNENIGNVIFGKFGLKYEVDDTDNELNRKRDTGMLRTMGGDTIVGAKLGR